MPKANTSSQTGQKGNKGTVSIREKNNAIEIYFTYKGKRRTLGGGSYTPLNLKVAQRKAHQIEMDILSDNLDESLDKYRSQVYLEKKEKAKILTPLQLWEQYFEFIKPSLKQTTCSKYHKTFTPLFSKIGEISVIEAEQVKKKVLQITTVGQARETIVKLSAACDWAKRKKLLETNPYEGLAREMPRPRYAVESKPNAFTPEEKEAVLNAFATDTRPGLNFRHYRFLVEFWFLTGCRPSEGIGLQWKHVAPDYSIIKFEGSVTTAGSSPVPIRVMGSKTNKTRQFTCSPKLKELLQSIKPEPVHPEDLVFPSPRGGAINYTNFATRIWSKVVDPIKPNTTPYCCRDTFITTQIMNGVQESIIAYWCDNSVEVIQKHYADFIKMSQITPTDY